MSTPDKDAPTFGDALVGEIKAEMGRQNIGSVRALAELLGTNNVYWNDRLNKKPGQRTPITMPDLARLSAVLHVEPQELVGRAWAASQPPDPDVSSTTDVG